ncbi:MAG: hypothetical protein JRJ27_06060 [Deltaproteobacteria bacterium]|nr:hypothetical protein [Deltaproteobacteria bacterium]MBW2363692.1 hypothetical protein [Deltaproteobacteria bacterium]
MLKTLIAVEADLASRMAIRYACQLGRPADLEINTIHIIQPEDHGDSPGTGWVHQTWEDAVIQKTKNEISQMVKSEQASSRILSPPQVVTGNRDQQITGELKFSHYDFFTEGIFHSFEPVDFFKKIRSPLYKDLPCPALMVKNWVSLTKGILFISESSTLDHYIKLFLKIFHTHSIEPEILLCKFDKKSSSSRKIDNSPQLVQPIEQILGSQGLNVKNIITVEGSVSALIPLVSDYSLILSSVPDEKSQMAKLLSKSPCSILFCP